MCYWAYERSEVWSLTHPKAAKEHNCCVCLMPIRKGCAHDRVNSMFDGVWSTDRMHKECHELCRDIQFKACGQKLYVLDVDIRHDVMEHMVEHPWVLSRWAEICAMRAEEMAP